MSKGVLSRFCILVFLIFFISIVSEGISLSGSDNQIELKAQISKDAISLGDVLNYRIVIVSNINLNNPKIKVLDLEKDFNVLSSNRIQNYKISAKGTVLQIILEYVLQPKKAGKIIIPSAELAYAGKVYKSEKLTVEVKPSSNPPPSLPEKSGIDEPATEKITL